MSDIQPEVVQRRTPGAAEFSTQWYLNLVSSPVETLRSALVTVAHLPDVPDGTEVNLSFAATPSRSEVNIVIDENADRAWGLALGKGGVNGAIQKPMVVSRMRSSDLGNARYAATRAVRTQDITADLWVTEQQTGCTVLILKWGAGEYSLVHLQPSEDNDFNWIGQVVMGLDRYAPSALGSAPFKSLYKNTWLRREMTSVLDSTARAPTEYILVQSMFDWSRGNEVQIVGVRSGREFAFYRQMVNRGLRAEALAWSPWYSMVVPYSSY